MKEKKTLLGTLKKILGLADKIMLYLVEGVCILCFTGLFFLALANVLIRFVPLFSLHFFDEVQVWLLGAMIFWGAAGLWALRDHLKIDDVAKFLFGRSRAARAIVEVFIELASMFFICVFTNACLGQTLILMGETNYLRVPEKIVFLTAMLIPAFIMVIYSVRNIAVSVVKLVRSFRPQADAAKAAPGA